ncbi:hypothetical protein C8J57DRAFT_1259280 [Mycena rebaudengoi]|nr:hypothetical protein C8J57DRAFT_1259280 [Mycena rebaudengoi]
MALWDAEHAAKPRILNIFLPSYLFRASRGVLGCGARAAKPRKQKYSHVRAASAQFFEPSAAVCATEPRRWNFSYVFRPPAGLCCQQAQIFESPTVGLLAMERVQQSHANTKILASLAVEPAGAAGYLRRANTNDLIHFFQKFRRRQANAATSFVQISWPPVAPVVSEGIFSSIRSSGPETNISEYDMLIHPPTCENHGAAQTRNIPPTDISKIFSSRGIAYNPEEIS